MVYPLDAARCYENVFISDIHLGTRGCQADKLLEFLSRVSCKNLYLVGDIIDGWQLEKRNYWPDEHKAVMNEFLRLAKSGTRVVFITGNHDEFLRHYSDFSFGNVTLTDEIIFESKKGDRYLVVHGDKFDVITSYARWIAIIGDYAYNFLLRLNVLVNFFRKRMGLPYWSLSAYIKHRVKRAVNFISDFESNVSRECTKRGFRGAICGHIHHAAIHKSETFDYMNCGDWVESCTALIECLDGEFQIVDWLHPGKNDNVVTLPSQPAAVPDPGRHAA
ncbi:MAG: UDP-2,3-diacylglucosamine diphosphatase [Gammaproteobacteria bacterium TMED92]|nr:MAG: UDP-2,3-diacylglucosamine diphosphatase [Gammaproteobacteria bacterium TMED92]